MLTLLTVSGCLILLQVQAINFIMCTAIFLRKRKLLSQGSLTSATLLRQRRRWQDRRPRRFWVRLGRTSAWWDNMMDNATVASEWKENFRMSHPTLPSWNFVKILDPYFPGVVVVCKRSEIRISFQCKRLRIRIL